MKHSAYLSLGSNIGERAKYLKLAIQMLQERQDIEVACISSVYETTPVDYENQPNFLNLVCRIQTALDPYALLDVTQNIENALGRQRNIRFGPRTIDIDILTFDTTQIDNGRLKLPHPRMHERAFVMIPLEEINDSVNGSQPLKGELRRIGTIEELNP